MRPNVTRSSIMLMALVAVCLLLPAAAHAGGAGMFCGLAGMFGRSPTMKIVASAIVVLLCAQAMMGKINWSLVFWICVPIVVLGGGLSLLHGLTGENCEPDEPTEISLPGQMGGLPTASHSPNSAFPGASDEPAPAGSLSGLPEAHQSGHGFPGAADAPTSSGGVGSLPTPPAHQGSAFPGQ